MTLWILGRRGERVRPGGDLLQQQEQAELLRAAGWEVVHAPRAEAVEPAEGDLVHLVNIQRCHDWKDLPERTLRSGARLVLTPLYHSLQRYHREGRRGLDGLAARCVSSPDRLAGLRWWRGGVADRARELLEQASRVLLAHEAEEELLSEELGAKLQEGAGRVVPVAIPGEIPGEKEPPELSEDLALSVGRVEPLKNSLAVAEAARAAGLPLKFVGEGPSWRHLGYASGLRMSSAYLGPWSYLQVRRQLRAVRVHVLASWTEVVGRSTLEAALSGAAVVLSDVGFAPDYLGRDTEGVFLCDPGDPTSLRRAIEQGWERGRKPDSELVRRVQERFTWRAVGPSLLEGFEG